MASQREEIRVLQGRIRAAADRARTETSGWVIRRPLMEEVSNKLEFVVAESKAETDEPLVLPIGIEATLVVEQGAVICGGDCLYAPCVWTIHPTESRLVNALVYPTRVIGMFYRVRQDGE